MRVRRMNWNGTKTFHSPPRFYCIPLRWFLCLSIRIHQHRWPSMSELLLIPNRDHPNDLLHHRPIAVVIGQPSNWGYSSRRILRGRSQSQARHWEERGRWLYSQDSEMRVHKDRRVASSRQSVDLNPCRCQDTRYESVEGVWRSQSQCLYIYMKFTKTQDKLWSITWFCPCFIGLEEVCLPITTYEFTIKSVKHRTVRSNFFSTSRRRAPSSSI